MLEQRWTVSTSKQSFFLDGSKIILIGTATRVEFEFR